MTIELEPYTLGRKELFKLTFLAIIRRSWWLWIVMVGMGLWILSKPLPSKTATILAAVMFFYSPVFAALYALYVVREPKVGHVQIRFRLVDDFLEFSNSKGSEGKMTLGEFVKAEWFLDYLLLYATRTNYVIIPLRAFRTEEDRKSFEAKLLEHGLMK